MRWTQKESGYPCSIINSSMGIEPDLTAVLTRLWSTSALIVVTVGVEPSE